MRTAVGGAGGDRAVGAHLWQVLCQAITIEVLGSLQLQWGCRGRSQLWVVLLQYFDCQQPHCSGDSLNGVQLWVKKATVVMSPVIIRGDGSMVTAWCRPGMFSGAGQMCTSSSVPRKRQSTCVLLRVVRISARPMIEPANDRPPEPPWGAHVSSVCWP